MIEVRVIERMPGLPYSESYARWEEHVDGCGECQSAIAAAAIMGGLGAVAVAALCETGEKADLEMQANVSAQREVSRLN